MKTAGDVADEMVDLLPDCEGVILLVIRSGPNSQVVDGRKAIQVETVTSSKFYLEPEDVRRILHHAADAPVVAEGFRKPGEPRRKPHDA